MKVLVTGGTGFIGNHVVGALLQANAEVIVTGMSEAEMAAYQWRNDVSFVQLNIDESLSPDILQKIGRADKVIHLIWSGLPNYKELFHFEKNLWSQYSFLKQLVDAGMDDITVTGTCFEYGMKGGALSVDMETDPQNPYALAKDCLRKFLQQLQVKKSFSLKWLRLFYMYGQGQSQKSILAQLDQALANGEKVFNMSGGEQVRDYLPVEEVAQQIAAYALGNETGIFNVCSGEPVRIIDLVKNHLAKRNKTIELNLGFYPYPDYEPMAFWGVK